MPRARAGLGEDAIESVAGLSYGDAIGGRRRRRPAPSGRPADLLVVHGNPTREITALCDVLDVWQSGRRVEPGVR